MSKSNSFGCAGLVLLVLALGYCSRADRATRSAVPAASIGSNPGFVKGNETYNEFDARRDALNTGFYSGGYGCTDDCGGHDAGYQWAEDHDIDDPDDCGGKSWSFEEGCRAYAEEQSSERDDNPDDEE